jgi:hypothetical protein
MKRLALVTGILALAAPLALAQTSTWTSDPNHSEVDFSITHMTVSNIHGRFGHVAATIAYNEADVTKSTVNATIDVTAVDTGEEARNNHLKSPDFFDVATYPSATFTSTSVAKSGERSHHQRQPHAARRNQAGGAHGGWPARPGAGHGPQAARRLFRNHHHQALRLWHRQQVPRLPWLATT